MESHANRGFRSVHQQPSLLSWLSLLVLLSYLLLPAVYYNHLTEAFPVPACQAQPAAGLLAIRTLPEKSPVPGHDPNNCPICRAASSFQDYGSFPGFQAPDGASPVRLTVFIDPTPSITDSDFWVSGPRAPPVSL